MYLQENRWSNALLERLTLNIAAATRMFVLRGIHLPDGRADIQITRPTCLGLLHAQRYLIYSFIGPGMSRSMATLLNSDDADVSHRPETPQKDV